MSDGVRKALSSGVARAAIIGVAIGLSVAALLLILRGQRAETIVLEVRQASDPNIVRVYVGGAVSAPGVYDLRRGSRVADAITAAGGATSAADTSRLGMAAPLQDADQVIVPTRIPPTTPATPLGSAGVVAPTTAGMGSTPAAASQPGAGAGGELSPGSIIDINTADADELDRLPGVGPVIAERIIAHREANGPFQSVDELEAIEGISDRMVEEMRAFVTAGP